MNPNPSPSPNPDPDPDPNPNPNPNLDQVTAVTVGVDFWPLSHIDNDFGPTVLVCVHLGNGPSRGGDFSFAADGHVVELRDGDVLVYNPLVVHGTTEFEYAHAADGCYMLAFFCSAKTLKGCATKTFQSER